MRTLAIPLPEPLLQRAESIVTRPLLPNLLRQLLEDYLDKQEDIAIAMNVIEKIEAGETEVISLEDCWEEWGLEDD